VSPVRWLVMVVAVVLILGLVVYARGPEHHRGDDIGTHGTPPPAQSP